MYGDPSPPETFEMHTPGSYEVAMGRTYVGTVFKARDGRSWYHLDDDEPDLRRFPSRQKATADLIERKSRRDPSFAQAVARRMGLSN